MTALVLLEYHFYKCTDENIYCDRVIDYKYLERYLKVFDDIILIGRMSEFKGEYKDKLLVSGENVKFIGLPEFVGIKGIIKHYKEIIKIIKNVLPDISCCIMRAPNHLSLMTYRLFTKEKIPFALEFNIAADKFIENNSIIGKMINKAVVKETKRMCLEANGVSYVTDHILQESYPCTAIIDKNNNNYFTASYSTIDLTEEMFCQQNWKKEEKPEKFIIVHTGYMDSNRKGQKVLIEALKNVMLQGYNNVEVYLVGDGAKRKEFENLVKDLSLENYVHFMGIIKKKDELMSLLKQCHMLVFPTQSEGLPRSIIEAMAVGLVCISSPVDGIPELLEPEFMIDYNNSIAYANKIIELINDWPKMIEVSENNYCKSLKYKKDNLENKRNEFYQKLKKISEVKDEK